jgi:ABC-type phosphate/phosphonate transport system substrate-binding protein
MTAQCGSFAFKVPDVREADMTGRYRTYIIDFQNGVAEFGAIFADSFQEWTRMLNKPSCKSAVAAVICLQGCAGRSSYCVTSRTGC